MAKFVFLLAFCIATVLPSPIISGLTMPMSGPWSSSPDGTPVDQVVRHARDADFTFEDYANPCGRFFQCLMPDLSEAFLTMFVNFDMQGATEILSRACPHVEEEPDNCDRGRCSDFHLSTNFYRMPQIRYQFLSWSCGYLNAFRAGRACWSPPFRDQMLTCLRIHGNPGIRSPEMALMLDCFDEVVFELETCTVTDAIFIHSINHHLVDIWTEVFDNVDEEK